MNHKRIFLSKGTHIVVANTRLPLRNAVYFDVADGRMVFAIPRQRATYIGTTDTPYHGDTNHVFAEVSEVKYLLDAANAMFPDAKLTERDVESTWAGLRPLIYEEGKSAGEMSRKDELFISATGLISVAGGKLTGYRKMAQKLVDLVLKRQGQAPIVCLTKHISLTEPSFENFEEVAGFQRIIEAELTGFDNAPQLASYLVENYGSAAKDILHTAFSSGERTDESIIMAELRHCLDHEMVRTPTDFLERRTGLLYFNIARAKHHLDGLLKVFANEFNWQSDRVGAERNIVLDLMKRLRPVPDDTDYFTAA